MQWLSQFKVQPLTLHQLQNDISHKYWLVLLATVQVITISNTRVCVCVCSLVSVVPDMTILLPSIY